MTLVFLFKTLSGVERKHPLPRTEVSTGVVLVARFSHLSLAEMERLCAQEAQKL